MRQVFPLPDRHPAADGTQRLMERLDGAGPKELEIWLAEVNDISQTMKAVSACGLGMAAPLVVESLVRYFPEQVELHVKH